MNGGKSFIVNVNTKVAVAAALGAGVLVGAGTAYLLTRINEHTHLTQQISSLHATILEVKRDLASLETGLSQKELGNWQELEKAQLDRDPVVSRSAFRKKTVSFSSTTTTGSYHTAREYDTDSSRANDTDYYSPDEDDDEFFDLSPDDSLEVITFGKQHPTSSPERSRLLPLSLEDESLYEDLQQVDVLNDGTAEDQTKAYQLLKKELQAYSQNAEVLWRLAKATKNMAAIQEKLGNVKEREKLIFEAYDYAARALKLNEEHPEIHKWYAILSGARGEFLGIKERVQSGNVFKEHIDRALDLNPDDSTLHHLLGRFCFEVSQLSWLERRAAATLFGEVPSSSFEEALQHFQAAEELRSSGWKENRLFIAKCYIQLSNYIAAASWLQRAFDAPIITPDDEIVHKEVWELQVKYASYTDL
ncbi:regulator of microtubule dynamics protein 1-like isoform X1 [Macrobrachium nipponense]|uniref:regulator of microtubule dynamics protein 1-like isoform X1 n=1 Tax=Macrobrachium nipponense TaxID=159736 RepID=UPI0030C8AB08